MAALDLLGDEMMPQVAPRAGGRWGGCYSNEEWYSPPHIVALARQFFGEIDLDPASCEAANEVVGAVKYFTKGEDGLAREWFGRVWLNPPYTAGVIDRFADKVLLREYDEAIVLTNAIVDTKAGQKLLRNADAVLLPATRLRFWQPGYDGSGAGPVGQMITYWGRRPAEFYEDFQGLGPVMLRFGR